MFALEIDFHDGVSPAEMVFVRRPHAIVGTSDYSHVVIEGAASNLYEVRITRGLGREFRCQPISKSDHITSPPPFLEGVYTGEAELNLGDVTTIVTSLDVDLLLRDGEAPDLAGVRVLRRALRALGPVFPAISVLGPTPLFVSFRADETIAVGRSRKCGLRLDAADVSAEHARFGYEEDHFWVEDLGSTNGTFVNEERVSGRRFLEIGESVSIGSEYVLAGVRNQEEVMLLSSRKTEDFISVPVQQRYPCLIADSETVRPARFVVRTGSRVTLGRDPANDIWVGAPHISRNHAELRCDEDGRIYVTDTSSNGVDLNGSSLEKNQEVEIQTRPAILDFREGVKLVLVYSEEDEQLYFDSGAELQPSPVGEGEPRLSPRDEQPVLHEELFGQTQQGDELPADTEPEDAWALSADEGSGSPSGVFERLAQEASNRERAKDFQQDEATVKDGDSFFDDAVEDSGISESDESLDGEFAQDAGENRVFRILAYILTPVLIVIFLAAAAWFLISK